MRNSLRWRSAQQKELLRLHIRPCLQSVEVHVAREIAPVEADGAMAGFVVPILKNCELLAEGVEICECHV